MKKILAVALAAASTTTALAFGAPSASATGEAYHNCPAYPPGKAYGVAINDEPRTVDVGDVTRLTVRAYKGGVNCRGYRLVLFTRLQNEGQYHGRAAVYTGDGGLTHYDFKVPGGFQYKWAWYTPAKQVVFSKSAVVFKN